MSLLIVGSCSRITSSIIQALARNKQYSKITLGDLLPTYPFHHRYYRLRRDLDQEKLSIDVKLQKLHETIQIHDYSRAHDDVLFVTHDYYSVVTSKLKLMELTALANKSRPNLYFATPVEYDQFGYKNPEERYLEVQDKVREINPNATIIRSDVQDRGQTVAYINNHKNVWEDQLFNLSYNQKFRPRIVSTDRYAKYVAEAIQQRVQGKLICLVGKQEESAKQIDFDRTIEKSQFAHMKGNVRHMIGKYAGIIGQGSQQEVIRQNR